jgi:uncharacterized protein
MIKLVIFLCGLSLSLFAANALENEASPYLRQHAQNPVNWIAWSDDVVRRAREEHKPIFLSIGYSTCHWCHVMAHESFENEAIAKIINTYFIAVKIDREEMSHIDSYYQQQHRRLKGRSGGWPLNALLTEEGDVLWIGTYIPPKDVEGNMGMVSLMGQIGEGYRLDSAAYIKQAKELKKLQPHKSVSSQEITPKALYDSVLENYDSLFHGFSIAPKFPEASKIALLLDLGKSGNIQAQTMGLEVLRSMALSGLYDQVEGGFFRYSTDGAWEIPHFEKMLYNQAELISLYARAYNLTNDPLYADIVRETIEMTYDRFGHDNLFYSASDADSDHHEGGYFIYSADEITRLNPDDSIREAFALDDVENFDDKYHLRLVIDKRPDGFKAFTAKLKKLRDTRDYPFIDEKIITSWNAMMIEALYKAGSIDPSMTEKADSSLNALLNTLYRNEELYHQTMSGYPMTKKGLLEDYAFVISALITGYESTFDEVKLDLAKKFTDDAILRFHTKEGWVQNAEGLKVKVDLLDKYTTSGYGKMMQNLFNLAALTDEPHYSRLAQKSLEIQEGNIFDSSNNAPSSMIAWLMGHHKVVHMSHQAQVLRNNQKVIENIAYPYIVIYPEQRDDFSACITGACFVNDKDIYKVIKEIESLVLEP